MNFADDDRQEQPENTPDAATPSVIITIKIKKSDSQIVRVTVNTEKDLVSDLKERAFKKEREERKTIRLIFQGKVL